MDVDIDFSNFQTKRRRKRSGISSNGNVSMEAENVVEFKNNENIATQFFSESKDNVRKIPVPSHRYTPLKENWSKIFTAIVEHMKLQLRFNLKTRDVEIRAYEQTEDIVNLHKAADFVKAFILGFDVDDALALLKLNDLFIESFEIQDVKNLKGDHRSRAIGRLAGKGGTTKFTIENVTKTRIVLADSKIHILGSYQNIHIARRAICNLILGLPPSKVHGQLRNIASSVSQRM